MTNTDTTLEPCPFCGGVGEISYYARPKSPAPAGHFVECVSCAAAGPSIEIMSATVSAKAEAIAAWNQRTNPTDCCEVERLRNLLALADDTLMESIGAFPLQGHPLRAACLAIRSETGDDYQERKRRAATAIRKGADT